jgi:hypothetical protein
MNASPLNRDLPVMRHYDVLGRTAKETVTSCPPGAQQISRMKERI